MSGNFINFADYMGLNDEAGQEMLNKSMVEGDKRLADATASSNAHYASAREAGEGRAGGEAAFKRTGEEAQRGLASYSDFMKGMADPASRQALMEKTYGRGTSWLDSALTGASGAGRIAQGQQDLQRTQRDFEERGIRAGQRKGRYADQTAQDAAAAEAYKRQQQAAYDEKEKEALGRKFAEMEFDTATPGDPSDPNFQRLNKKARDQQIEMRAKYFKATGPDGRIDWSKYRSGTDAMNKKWDEGTANDVGNWGIVKGAHQFFSGLGGGKTQEKQKPETWDSYYSRSRTNGAK